MIKISKNSIIFTFYLSIAVLIIVGVYAYRSTNQHTSATEWVNRAEEIIAQTQEFLVDLQDIETSQRGYVITGENKYLDSYEAGVKSIDPAYLKLKELTKDNESRQDLLDSVYITIQEKISFSKNVVEVRKKNGFEAAQKLVKTGLGEDLKIKIRNSIAIITNSEKKLLVDRLEAAKESSSKALSIIALSIALAVTIVSITLFFFIKDYDIRIRAEKKLIESEDRIKKFLESLPLGIYVLGADNVPYYANKKSEEILGKGIVPNISSADLPEVYQTYIAGTDELYPAEKLPVVLAINGQKNVLVEDLEIAKEGRKVPLRINATYITDSEGKIEYAIAVFDDVTDIRETEKKLIIAKKLAEESSVLKEAFLANMSHEIRTPMNAIIGFTEILLKRDLDSQEKEYVRIIKTSGENLLRIINDVLDVSKIESGMMNFEIYTISIKEIFSSLNIMLSHKAKEKNLSLSFSYDSNLPDYILGDPTRITQIILNLVGNAIKFTNKGSVEIFAKVLKQESENYIIEFSIRDSGIGIAEEKLKHIFERFTQAESHTTRQYGGTGLGLSIAKQLIELQGGSISVKSEVNSGSVFIFTLPFKKAIKPSKTSTKKIEDSDIRSLINKKILLVEDNFLNIKFLTHLLDLYGIKIELAENGKVAVEKIKANTYDIVLMDIEMPIMNGYEATSIIRNVLKNNVTIIAMTAHAMAGEQEKCIQLGMNGYLSKPISSDLLFEKLLNLDSLSNSTESKQNEAKEGKLVNLEFLKTSMRGNTEIVNTAITIFLEQVPTDVLSINTAISNLNYSSIRQVAHNLKSSMALMGILEIELLLEKMEKLATDKSNIEEICDLQGRITLLCEKAMKEIKLDL